MKSITDKIYSKFPYKTSAKEIQTISDYKNAHKMGNKGTLIKEIIPVQLVQEGGAGTERKISNIEFEGTNYEYYIEKMTPETNDKRRICFMSDSYSYDCLCFMFGTKETGDTTIELQSLLNSSECIKVLNNDKKIKSDDTLMKIFLKFIKNKKFSHIKRIELSDVSKKQCYDIGLELVYLRTMTDGIPYYAKFGFRPKTRGDYENFQANREIFKTSPMILSKDLLEIINSNIKYMHKGTYEIYKKYLHSYIKNHDLIDPKILFSEIVNLADVFFEKKEYTKNKLINNKNLTKEEIRGFCDFASSIYKKVYKYIGYQEYNSSIWVLNLK
jgi:hypothetical protein